MLVSEEHHREDASGRDIGDEVRGARCAGTNVDWSFAERLENCSHQDHSLCLLLDEDTIYLKVRSGILE